MQGNTNSEKPKRIKDVSVNRDAVTKAGSLDEFKKVNPEIFSHLSDADQAAAYQELWSEGFSTAAPAPSVKAPAANADTSNKP